MWRIGPISPEAILEVISRGADASSRFRLIARVAVAMRRTESHYLHIDTKLRVENPPHTGKFFSLWGAGSGV